MEFSIERKLLLDLLSVGGSMSGKSKVLPILDSCKVKLFSGKIIVSSYDGENAVLKSGTVINHDEDFSFCVNCSDFMKAIRSLKDAVLDFRLDGGILIIKHLRGYMELPYESSDEFPQIDNVTDGESYVGMDSELLFTWLSNARNFAANDALRPVLCGVYLYFKDGEYGVCASDGTSMYTDYRITDLSVNMSAVITNAAIGSLLGVLKDSSTVDIRINDRNISFSCSDSRMVCRLPNGVYPNFKAVLPKEHSVTVRLSREDLMDAVNRAKLFSSNSTSLCVMETMTGELGVAAEDIDFSKKSVEQCTASIDGSIRIGAKGDILIKCLSSLSCEGVIIEMQDATRPIIFKDYDNPNLVILQMPMMIR